MVGLAWATGCARQNPLFGVEEGATGTGGLVDSTSSVTADNGLDATRGPINDGDPLPDDDDDDPIDTGDDDDDSVDTDADDDDDDDDDDSDTGPECPSVEDCVFDNSMCAPGDKCGFYDVDGIDGPDAVGCTPLDPSPGTVGDRCQIDGCGFDDCGVGQVCPRDAGSAVCAGLCTTTNLGCDDGGTCVDVLGPGGAVGACAPICDLVEQNCLGAGRACYLDLVPVCAPAGEVGQNGLCAFLNQCAPGYGCVPGASISACMGMDCCTEFCTVGEDTCPEPLSCVSLIIPEAPMVGVCVD